MPLREVTQEEITAARLRRMAKDLIREAEALEAKVCPGNTSHKHAAVLHDEFRQLAGKIKTGKAKRQ